MLLLSFTLFCLKVLLPYLWNRCYVPSKWTTMKNDATVKQAKLLTESWSGGCLRAWLEHSVSFYPLWIFSTFASSFSSFVFEYTHQFVLWPGVCFLKIQKHESTVWLLSTNLVKYCIQGFPGIVSPSLYTDCPDQHLLLLKGLVFIYLQREILSGWSIMGFYSKLYMQGSN